MGSPDLIEVDGLAESTAEEDSVAEKEKYFLELNGTLIDGYEPDDVARGLARLLRMTGEQAQQLIQGTPFRIHKELDKDKAEHLLAKMVACGAGAIIVPVHRRRRPQPISDHGTQIEGDVVAIQVEDLAAETVPTHLPEDGETAAESSPEPEDASVELTLELDPGPAQQDQEETRLGKPDEGAASPMSLTLEPPPVIEPDDEVTRPMEVVDPDDLEVEEQVVLETPAPFTRSVEDGTTEGPGRFMAQPDAAPPVAEEVKRKPARSPRGSHSLPDRRLLIGAGVVLVLMAAGWGALQLMGESRPEPVTLPVASPVDPRLASTRTRQNQLVRSVKVWMIEYGSGFDPAQVTLERLQADLEIAPKMMLDGWGTAFRYQPGEKRYTLTSAGPDRQFGSGDDLQRIETVE